MLRPVMQAVSRNGGGGEEHLFGLTQLRARHENINVVGSVAGEILVVAQDEKIHSRLLPG